MIGNALALLCVLAIVGLGLSSVRRNLLGPFAIFSYFFLLYYWLRSSLLLLGLDELTKTDLLRTDQDNLVLEVLLIAALGYLSAFVGYVAASRVVLFSSLGHIFTKRTVDPTRITWLCTLLASAVLVELGFLLAQTGGVGSLLFQARREELFKGADVLKAVPLLASYAASGALVMVWRAARTPDSPTRGARRAQIVALVTLICTTAFFLSIGERAELFYPLLAALLALHYSGARIGFVRFLAACVGLVILLTTLGELRSLALTAYKNDGRINYELLRSIDSSGVSAPRRITKGLNIDTVDHFAILLQDFDHSTFRYGLDFYHGAIGVVPRALWSEKPETISPGTWFKLHYYGSADAGLPFSVIGEWWINFGVIGVTVGMFLSGLFLRAIDTWIKRFAVSGGAAFLGACIVLNILALGIGAMVILQLAKTIIPLTVFLFLFTAARRRAAVWHSPANPAL